MIREFFREVIRRPKYLFLLWLASDLLMSTTHWAVWKFSMHDNNNNFKFPECHKSVNFRRTMKLFFVLASVLGFLVFALPSFGKNKINSRSAIYFKTIKCNFSSEFVLSDYSCFAKSYSWSRSTVNMRIIFKQPLNNFFVRNF